MYDKKTTIMLSTSVYGFERDIVQICALLKELGYNVWNPVLAILQFASIEYENLQFGNDKRKIKG